MPWLQRLRHLKRAAAGVLVALLAALPVASPAQDAASGYRFSPVNQYGINLTAGYWNPIISYVSEKSGVKLALKIGRTSADTTAYVLAEEVEFVFSNHLFSPEREKLGWKVFARRNAPPLHGQIIAATASGINSLGELAGKQVSFAGREALIGYKMPHAALIAQGINVEVVFSGNQDAALTQLFNGRVAASGGNAQLLAGFAKREGKSYRVLWTSDPVQDLALMATSKVPAKDVAAVAQAFTGMLADPRGRSVLEQASRLVEMPATLGFVRSDGSEYTTERRFYQTAPASLR
jgi:phosphonate transport system substrate-binding protein